MYQTKRVSRIMSAFVPIRTRTIAQVAIGLLLALAIAACGSSEPAPSSAPGAPRSAPVAPNSAISAPVAPSSAPGAPRSAPVAPNSAISAPVAPSSAPAAPSRADVQDAVAPAVQSQVGEQLTAADVQKIMDESSAGQMTAADVQKIVDQSSAGSLSAADVQKIVTESSAGQMTAADVQKIVDASSAGSLSAADVQKIVTESASAAAAQSAESAPLSLASLSVPAPQPATQAAAQQSPPVTQQAGGYSGSPSGQAPAAQPSATTFRDYERSWFTSTDEDVTSTFSLDTDRTSFQLALNWARAGYEVEPDSVRAEEWINAFDYGYAPPAHRDSFAISTDVVRHPLDDRKHLARIGFQAPELQDDAPLNVTLVLDASGSMADGNRVDIAREAAESIRRSLRSGDRIGVVHFTTDVIHDLTVEHRGPDDREVRRSIDQLAPHGSTNVQAGLNLGVQLADRARREWPDAYNYIILMSDGVANVDATDPFAILESAYDADSRNPLRLITIGVGIENYNDYLLEQLAQHGNGWYRYLSDTHQAQATFSRDSWLALSIPFADQTRAQVTWNDEVVEYWRMIGYENRVTSDESFVEDRKEFAEIPIGAATTVFYELQLRDDAWRYPSETVELGGVQLRWVTPVSGLANRQATTMVSRLDRDFDYTGDPLLQFGALVALASDRYGSLPYIANDSDSAYVHRDLRDVADWLDPLGQQLGGLASLQDFAFVLDHITAALPADVTRSSGYSR